MWIWIFFFLPSHNMDPPPLLCLEFVLSVLFCFKNQSLVCPFHCFLSVTFTKTRYAVQSPLKHLGIPLIWHSVACRFHRWCVFWYVCVFLEDVVGRDWHVEVTCWINPVSCKPGCSSLSFSSLKLLGFVLCWWPSYSKWCISRAPVSALFGIRRVLSDTDGVMYSTNK